MFIRRYSFFVAAIDPVADIHSGEEAVFEEESEPN
jgi:hypothetical protein